MIVLNDTGSGTKGCSVFIEVLAAQFCDPTCPRTNGLRKVPDLFPRTRLNQRVGRDTVIQVTCPTLWLTEDVDMRNAAKVGGVARNSIDIAAWIGIPTWVYKIWFKAMGDGDQETVTKGPLASVGLLSTGLCQPSRKRYRQRGAEKIESVRNESPSPSEARRGCH
eukprot:INCI1098.3.p2 GENE.INCI1098.3~~INCI1098.3.p2  ORF type:complete len:165 (-),score=11.44 INCI1098.3:21-515(-)